MWVEDARTVVRSSSIAILRSVGCAFAGRITRNETDHLQPTAPTSRSDAFGAATRPWSQTAGVCSVLRHQRFSNRLQPLPPAAIGKKAVVADPHQPLGENMPQRPPDELPAVQCHAAVGLARSVVAVAQCHLVRVDGQETRIGDGDSARVAD